MMVILGTVITGLLVIKKWDKPLPLDGAKYMCIFAAAFLERCVIGYITAGEPEGNRIWFSVLGGCLLLAGITDIVLCQVYNFVWWIALAAAAALLWYDLENRGTDSFPGIVRLLLPLMFFCSVQFVLFSHMYGKADCYAFCVCAAGIAARGIGIAGFLFHMAFAYVLLFLVQAVRGNINRKGNLKHPVPFLPYIGISFWMTLALKKWLCHYPLFGIMEMLV